jgi:hypothetical protein
MPGKKSATKATQSPKPDYSRALQILRRAESRIQAQIRKLLKESGAVPAQKTPGRTRSSSELVRLLRRAEERNQRDNRKIMRLEETVRALRAKNRELAAELQAELDDDDVGGSAEPSILKSLRDIAAELRSARIDDHIWRRKNNKNEPYSIGPGGM